MSGELKTSQEWFDTLQRPHGTVVLDPDGWDRSDFNFSWGEELITREEFSDRLSSSTCIFDPLRWKIGNADN